MVIMSDFDGLPGDHPDLDSSESKSSASHESGLCSTMLAMDECLGSIEELSQHVGHELNSHFDHADRMQFELEVLRAQLAEKNRLISIQQSTIKKHQESLAACQRDMKEFNKAAETELMCKNETISNLQSDLVESQQQYVECFQQLISKDRILSDIREDDVILLQKITQLEIQLRKKTYQTIATQTDEPLALNNSTPPPYKAPPPVLNHRDHHKEGSTCNFDAPLDNGWSTNTTIHVRGHQSPLPVYDFKNQSTTKNPKIENKLLWKSQELLDEMCQIQRDFERPAESQQCFHRCYTKSNDDVPSGFWIAFTEERQQRIQLEHFIRKMELDMIELKNEVQSCKARLQIQQQQLVPMGNSYCLNKPYRFPTVTQPSSSCCFRDSCGPHRTDNKTTHLYTIV